jgi:hypothetical protein
MKIELKQTKGVALHVSLSPGEWKWIHEMYENNPASPELLGLCIHVDDDTLKEIKNGDRLSVCIGVKEEE